VNLAESVEFGDTARAIATERSKHQRDTIEKLRNQREEILVKEYMMKSEVEGRFYVVEELSTLHLYGNCSESLPIRINIVSNHEFRARRLLMLSVHG